MQKAGIILCIVLTIIGAQPIHAQTTLRPDIEAILIEYMHQMDYWRKQDLDNMDSLFAVDARLKGFLMHMNRDYSFPIETGSKQLADAGMNVSVSDDYKCATYSWLLCTYDAMHQRSGVMLYQTVDGIQGNAFSNGVCPATIYTIHTKDNKTIYLTAYENRYTLIQRYALLMAHIIERKEYKEYLTTTPLFTTAKDTTASVGYQYDLASYGTEKTIPAITISKDKRKLSVPIVSKEGDFTHNYKIYKFDGYHYKLTSKQ